MQEADQEEFHKRRSKEKPCNKFVAYLNFGFSYGTMEGYCTSSSLAHLWTTPDAPSLSARRIYVIRPIWISSLVFSDVSEHRHNTSTFG